MERPFTINRSPWITLFLLFPCIIHAQNELQDRISYTHDIDFSSGLPKPDWGKEYPLTFVSYITEDKGMDIHQLARISKDPYQTRKSPIFQPWKSTVSRTQWL